MKKTKIKKTVSSKGYRTSCARLPKDLLLQGHATKLLKITKMQLGRLVDAGKVKTSVWAEHRSVVFNKKDIEDLGQLLKNEPNLLASLKQLKKRSQGDGVIVKPAKILRSDVLDWENDLSLIRRAQAAINAGVPLNARINCVTRS